MKKILRTFIVMSFVAAFTVFLTGCEGETVTKPGEEISKEEKKEAEDTVQVKKPETGIEGAEVLKVLHQKPYVSGDTKNGYWKQTDVIKLDLPEDTRNNGSMDIKVTRQEDSWDRIFFEYEVTSDENFSDKKSHSCKGEKATFGFRYFTIDKTFPAGGYATPSWGVYYTLDTDHFPEDVYYSFYFADVEAGDDPFGQKVKVLDYFDVRGGTLDYPVEVNRLAGTGKIRGYNEEKGKLEDEQLFTAAGNFPKMAETGDKLYVVMDFYDGKDGELRTRDLWEYTFTDEPLGSEEEERTEEEWDELYRNDPNYEAREHDGCWDLTDIIYVGDDKENIANQDVDVKAERTGLDGQDVVYTFTVKDDISEEEGHDCTGEVRRITVPEYPFSGRYYVGGYFYAELRVFVNTDKEHTPGNIIGSVALCDVDFDTGKYGVKITPKQYFAKGYPPEEVQTFSPDDGVMKYRGLEPPKGPDDTGWAFLNLEGSFPAGEEDGEKIYLVYGLMDDIAGDIRMYNIYEYTYREGPVTEWVYNPAMDY